MRNPALRSDFDVNYESKIIDMKNSFYFLLLIMVFLACSDSPTPKHQPTIEVPSPIQVKKITNDLPFKLGLDIEYDQDEPWLNMDLELSDSSWTASPFSTDAFYLPFYVVLEESEYIKLTGTIYEIPPSLTEFDSWIEKEIQLIRAPTVISYRLDVSKLKDVVVKGKIELMIEPSCVPYTIDFVISRNDGILSAFKTDARVGLAKN